MINYRQLIDTKHKTKGVNKMTNIELGAKVAQLQELEGFMTEISGEVEAIKDSIKAEMNKTVRERIPADEVRTKRRGRETAECLDAASGNMRHWKTLRDKRR